MRQKFLLYHWFLLKNVENFTIETDCFCQFFMGWKAYEPLNAKRPFVIHWGALWLAMLEVMPILWVRIDRWFVLFACFQLGPHACLCVSWSHEEPLAGWEMSEPYT